MNSQSEEYQYNQGVDPFEFQNEAIDNMITDEDAEFKRGILQLIFIDDITTLL
jgi:hypothetical protein